MAAAEVLSHTFMPSSSSVTPLGTMFTTSAPAYSAGGVWPPPPLPPSAVGGLWAGSSAPASPFGGLDLTSRLATGRGAALDGYANSGVWPPPPLPPVSCEITARIEALERQRILSLEAVREKDLELDTVGAEWKAKVELLEARLRAQEAGLARQAEEAAREADFRAREEMRVEVQNIEVNLRRNYQEEMDRLKTELRQAEVKINELRMDLENERSGLRRNSTHSSITIEDLGRQLETLTNERDLLSTDNVHLKKANSQREQESSTLRGRLAEERKHMKLLENERDTLRAEVDAQRARARLGRDEEMLRQSFSSVHTGARSSELPTLIVDMTPVEDNFPSVRTSSMLIRREVELDEYDD